MLVCCGLRMLHASHTYTYKAVERPPRRVHVVMSIYRIYANAPFKTSELVWEHWNRLRKALPNLESGLNCFLGSTTRALPGMMPSWSPCITAMNLKRRLQFKYLDIRLKKKTLLYWIYLNQCCYLKPRSKSYSNSYTQTAVNTVNSFQLNRQVPRINAAFDLQYEVFTCPWDEDCWNVWCILVTSGY